MTEVHGRITLKDFVVLLFEVRHTQIRKSHLLSLGLKQSPLLSVAQFTRLWLMDGDDTNGELLVHQLRMLYSALVELDHDLQVRGHNTLLVRAYIVDVARRVCPSICRETLLCMLPALRLAISIVCRQGPSSP
jgi:hypothetical protein